MALQMTYDPEADALYIKLSDIRSYEGGDVGPLTLFYSENDQVVGVEILAASKVLAPGEWRNAPLPGEEAVIQAAE